MSVNLGNMIHIEFSRGHAPCVAEAFYGRGTPEGVRRVVLEVASRGEYDALATDDDAVIGRVAEAVALAAEMARRRCGGREGFNS